MKKQPAPSVANMHRKEYEADMHHRKRFLRIREEGRDGVKVRGSRMEGDNEGKRDGGRKRKGAEKN